MITGREVQSETPERELRQQTPMGIPQHRPSFLEMQKRKQARPAPPQQNSSPVQAPPADPPTPVPPAPGTSPGSPAGSGWTGSHQVPRDPNTGMPTVPYQVGPNGWMVPAGAIPGGSTYYPAGSSPSAPGGQITGQKPPGWTPPDRSRPAGGRNADDEVRVDPPPAHPSGWSPGMDPFAPQATTMASPMVNTSIPSISGAPQNTFDPNDPNLIRIDDPPSPGLVGPRGGGQPQSGGGFDIGKYITDMLGGGGSAPTFTPPPGSAGDYRPPGAPAPTAAPEPYTPEKFDYKAPGTAGATEELLARLIGNPSAYNSDVVKTSFDRLTGSIDDQYDMENRAIQEDMTRRGIVDSSVYGGRLQDSNVMRRSAKTEVAERLLDTAAQTYGSDVARAIAAGLGYNDQQFDQQMGQAGFNRDSGQMAFNNKMAAAGFNAQQSQSMFDNAMRSAQFGRDGQQMDFNRALQTFMADLNARGIQHGQQMDLIDSFMRYAQQQFQNQAWTASFNDNRDRWDAEFWRDIIGGT